MYYLMMGWVGMQEVNTVDYISHQIWHVAGHSSADPYNISIILLVPGMSRTRIIIISTV